jgi:hypothetical protein
MMHPLVATDSRPTYALCGISAALVAMQIGVVAQWSTAFAAASNQAGRVLYFLTHLPLGLGGLGVTNLTLLCIAAGAAGLVAAVVASRRLAGSWRALSVVLGSANGLLVVWYGFTLM